jgi:hypothetical protein
VSNINCLYSQILKDASRGVLFCYYAWLKEANELVLCLVVQLTIARTILYVVKERKVKI